MEHTGGGKQTKSHPPDLHIQGRFRVYSEVSIYHTTQLSDRLVKPRSDFDLTDPNGFLLSSEYKCLHDPNLRNYFYRKDIHQRLLDLGLITNDDKVICTLKEFNCYRKYLEEVDLSWSRRFLPEQKHLLHTYLTRLQQGQIPEIVTLSDVTEWLLGSGNSLFRLIMQATRARWFPAKNEFSLSRLLKITKNYNMEIPDCCSSATCSSKMIWNSKSRAMLLGVIKEVKREMRFERFMHTNKEQKEKMKQERQQWRLCVKGKKIEMHSPTKTVPQNSPETMKNIVSDPDNTQDLVCSTKTCLSIHQPSPYPEQMCERDSALCENLAEYVNQKSAISAHKICTDSPGLVYTVSSSLVTSASQFGQCGYLTQLSELKQRKTEEEFKGNFSTEKLEAIMQSVVVPGLKEANMILTPSIMTSKHDRLTDSSMESAGTCLKCPGTSTKSSNEGTVPIVKVESVTQEEVNNAVGKLEAKEDSRATWRLSDTTLQVTANMDSSGATDPTEKTHTEMEKHNPGCHEPSQSLSADDGCYLTLPCISVLNSAALSFKLIDEILDEVINILMRECQEVIFSEDRPCVTSSPDGMTDTCSATISGSQDQENYAQNLEEVLSDAPPKLIEGQATILKSCQSSAAEQKGTVRDIMP